MHQPPSPVPRHEPEIEVLRRIARIGLGAIRCAFWLVGAVAIYTGVFGPPEWTGLDWPPTHLFVFACAGLPLVLPGGWWIGHRRGALVLLVAAALMWFLPMLRAGDHRYGFVLRLFATVVACATMVVWRTLWRLGSDDVSRERP